MKKLLILLICLSILFTACSDGGTSSDTKTESLTLSVTEGKADFIFLIPEEVNHSVEEAVTALAKSFRENENADRINVYDDSRKENEDVVELLFGNTNREASKNALKKLRDREYTIGVYDGKFVVTGADDDATIDAVNYLYMHYSDFIKDGKISSKDNFVCKYSYPYDTIKVGDTDISAYTIVYPDPGGTYAEKESAQKYAATRLSQQISQLCGAILPTENEKNTDAEKQIVIEKAKGNYDYSVCVKGDKITISADSIYSYTKAFDALLSGDSIAKDFTASEKDVFKESPIEDFVYVDYTEGKVYSDKAPVGSIKIMGTDISKYKIVYDNDVSDHRLNEEYAAQQLSKYLGHATGVEVPVVTDDTEDSDYEIVIGVTDRCDMDVSGYGNEGFVIKTEGKKLIIAGGPQRGTLYGVYTFLENYIGCRFFAEDCEIIYKADEINIEEDLFDEQIPTMEYRDTNETIYQGGGEIASKRKINSSYTRAMKYTQGSSMDFAGGAFVHTMGTLFDLGSVDRQPCLSDEGVYEKTLEKARKIMKANPNAELISITQNDNNNACTCKECTLVNNEEGSRAGTLVRFINRLATELEDEFPDYKILTLAYMFSYEAPKTVPHKNVIIELCSLDACCGHPLCDLSCSTNQEFRRNIEDWSKLTDNLYVWYYVVEFTGNAKNAPFMNFNSLYDTYQLFRKYGVKGVFNEGNMVTTSREFGYLRAYLLSKLMWDEDMTREEYDNAIVEFIAAYYGEASDVVEEYFYMMASYADDRHFEQYAGFNGMFDLNKLGQTKGEVADWFDQLPDFTFTHPEIKNHVGLLKKGFNDINRYVK